MPEDPPFDVVTGYRVYKLVGIVGSDKQALEEIEINTWEYNFDFEYPFQSIEIAKKWLANDYEAHRNQRVVVLHTLEKDIHYHLI